MFLSPRQYRTFLILVLTYTLDLLGYSIAFPVFAPLLLNPALHFFSAQSPEVVRTTVLGLLFAVFGIAQLIAAPINGTLADHYGRYRVFLITIGVSVVGYVILAFGIYVESIAYLLLGRIVTGFCSGNIALAQSAAADLTAPKHRSRAFGILLGVGGLGFVVGPWIGGKLANPDWLFGSGAFVFAAIAALINFLVVLFFFEETSQHHAKHQKISLLASFKDFAIVVHSHTLRSILIASLFFSIGWAFFLVFFPAFLVKKFALSASSIGDVFAYMALIWFFTSTFLNKELTGKFSLQGLIPFGLCLAGIGVGCFLLPVHLWVYWIIIPIALTGAASSWVNFSTLLSLKASERMQGRVMGANSSSWSIGQTVAPLIAGPLAGWNIDSPLAIGVGFIALSLIFFLCNRVKD